MSLNVNAKRRSREFLVWFAWPSVLDNKELLEGETTQLLQTTFPFRVQQNVSSSALLPTSQLDARPFPSKQVPSCGTNKDTRKYVNLVQSLFFFPFGEAFIQNRNWVVVRHSTQKTSLHRWLLRRRHHAFHSAHHHIPFSR